MMGRLSWMCWVLCHVEMLQEVFLFFFPPPLPLFEGRSGAERACRSVTVETFFL